LNINDRVKLVREARGMTLEQFGSRLNITAAAVSYIEKGKGGVSKRNIAAMNREFGVSENWLLTGDGDMFETVFPEMEIARFMNGILTEDSSFKKRFVSVLARMSPEEWDILENKIDELSGGTKETAPD